MAFKFEPYKETATVHVENIPINEKYGYIRNPDGGSLTVTSWLFNSCACAGLENMGAMHSWDPVLIDPFLKFLGEWTSPYGWKPKKFYFLVKVFDEYGGRFLKELKNRARLCDEFDNHAHHSTGKLGLYTLEVWE